jgi:hypothetical protein
MQKKIFSDFEKILRDNGNNANNIYDNFYSNNEDNYLNNEKNFYEQNNNNNEYL